MRLVLSSVMLAASTFLTPVFGATVTIPMSDLPLKNGAVGAVYKMADHPNSVFVFESYKLSCVYCNQNARNVDKLATEYAANTRVQVLDLGLDSADSDFAEWIRIHASNHPVVQDVGFKIFKALRSSNNIPQVFIVNCKGELAGTALGEWDAGAAASVRGYINTALKTTCPTIAQD